MLRFQPMEWLQKFAPVHALLHNQLTAECHLVDRQNSKQIRSVALAKRKSLAGWSPHSSALALPNGDEWRLV